MLFSLLSSIGNRGSYSSIPDEPPQKIATSIETVLTDWNPSDEIKYQLHHNPEAPSEGRFYSNVQQPESFFDWGLRFLARFGKPEEKAAHQAAVEAAVTQLKNGQEHLFGTKLENDFALSKFLGQPLTVGYLRNLRAATQRDTEISPPPSIKENKVRSYSFLGMPRAYPQTTPPPSDKKTSSFSVASYQRYQASADQDLDIPTVTPLAHPKAKSPLAPHQPTPASNPSINKRVPSLKKENGPSSERRTLQPEDFPTI